MRPQLYAVLFFLSLDVLATGPVYNFNFHSPTAQPLPAVEAVSTVMHTPSQETSLKDQRWSLTSDFFHSELRNERQKIDQYSPGSEPFADHSKLRLTGVSIGLHRSISEKFSLAPALVIIYQTRDIKHGGGGKLNLGYNYYSTSKLNLSLEASAYYYLISENGGRGYFTTEAFSTVAEKGAGAQASSFREYPNTRSYLGAELLAGISWIANPFSFRPYAGLGLGQAREKDSGLSLPYQSQTVGINLALKI